MQLNTPPKLADRLLRIFCASHRLEEVQGDLHEEFQYQTQRSGLRRAQWRYWWDVLGFLKPRFTRNKQSDTYQTTFLTNPTMIRNYVSIAFRQLWKNPLFSGLNVIGLTVGLAVSTFIALYVWHEFHYDRFEPFADRTYRITSIAKFGGEDVIFQQLHHSFGSEAKRQIPEVEHLVRVSEGFGEAILQADPTHQFKEKKIGFADASVFPVMGLKLLYGDVKTALQQPGEIVLTRELAAKYFGQQNPVGKTIRYDKHYPLTVVAVLADLPTNSVLQFNGLISLSSMPKLGDNQRNIYESAGFLSTFLVLRPNAHVTEVEKKLAKVKAGIQFVDMSASYELESLPSLHLDARGGAKDARQSLYILLTVALVILLLAIINYISLTTARATKRSREVGIRKAIGGLRNELIGQFFLESFLTTTFAFGLSLLVLQALFPWANHALELRMDSRILSQAPYWFLMISLWLTCSLLSGIYPALLLSGFRPAVVLKGGSNSGQHGTGIRRVFTTVQFAASIGLLICSLVLYTQMRFLRTKNIGLNREQVLALHIDSEMTSQFTGLRDAIRQWAGPQNVATTNTQLFTNNISTYFLKTQKTKKQLMVNTLKVDKAFFDMMGIQWKYRPNGWDKKPINRDLTIYNQSVMKAANITGNPFQQDAPFKDQPTDGVVADFHVQSLHGYTSPMQLTVVSDTNRSIIAANGGYLLIRLAANSNVTQALDQLKTMYDNVQPTAPFDYYFLDDAYDKLYARETRLMRLFNSFTTLTLLVACLGLLGMITFSIEVRTKEIGVRKVLGASVSGIVVLLSKDFLKLIGIALLLSSPITWWAMNKWLEDFAYKINIEWWMFALAGGVVAGMAVITVSFQSIKAALMNPVKSLRSE